MKRYFNTEGICKPNIHYMVRIDERLEKIKRLYVDKGKYFVINKGRQYGKTTTLMALEQYLKNDYVVVFLDFQKMSDDSFGNGRNFARSFAKNFIDAMNEKQKETVSNTIDELLKAEKTGEFNLESLFTHLSGICGKAVYRRTEDMAWKRVSRKRQGTVGGIFGLLSLEKRVSA